MKRVIVGLFQDFAAARVAVGDLAAVGIPTDDVSVITCCLEAHPIHHSGDGMVTETTRDARAGAVVGGVAGLLLGLTPLVVPGVGPALVAGWLFTTLAGATFGAVTGGFAGALIDMGIHTHSAERYNEAVVRGDTLVIARAHSEFEAQVVEVMQRDGAVEVHEEAAETT